MKWPGGPKQRLGWPASLVTHSDMDGDNNKRVEGAETSHESVACISGQLLKAAKEVGMYFLLVLVIGAHCPKIASIATDLFSRQNA